MWNSIYHRLSCEKENDLIICLTESIHWSFVCQRKEYSTRILCLSRKDTFALHRLSCPVALGNLNLILLLQGKISWSLLYLHIRHSENTFLINFTKVNFIQTQFWEMKKYYTSPDFNLINDRLVILRQWIENSILFSICISTWFHALKSSMAVLPSPPVVIPTLDNVFYWLLTWYKALR